MYALSQSSVRRPGVGESPQCSVVVPDRVFTAPFLYSQLSQIEFPLFPPTLFFKLEICVEVRRLSSSKLLGFFSMPLLSRGCFHTCIAEKQHGIMRYCPPHVHVRYTAPPVFNRVIDKLVSSR